MSRTAVQIDGVPYRIARLSKNGGVDPTGNGMRAFGIDSRPWQQGDPAQKVTALWHPDGPQLYSQEEISESVPEGYLGVAYADGTDSRWANKLTLGPALSGITLNSKDTTFPETLLGVSALLGVNTGLGKSSGAFSQNGFPATTVSDIEWTQSSVAGTYYAYFLRDGYISKVDLSTLLLVETKALGDLGIDAIAVQGPSGTREVAVALNSAAYQVANPIGTTDTWAANSSNVVRRVFGIDPLRVVGGYLGTNGQTVYAGNVLTSVVTMLAPAWFDVTTITGKQSVIPTGFTTDGARWVMQTSGGPYYMDPSLGVPFALIGDAMDTNPENGRQGGYWPFLGAIIPGRYGARYQNGLQGRSFGVETFDGNRTPVQGYPTGGSGNTRWYYQAVYNPTTTTTWLIAWRPDARETRQTSVMSPFVIGKIGTTTAAVGRALEWVGTANASRTTSVLLGGIGTNGWSMIAGETPQEIDDANYRFTLTGTAYLTEMRRFPHLLKDVEAVEFETTGCAAGRTITVTLVGSGDVATNTVTLNGSTAGVNDPVSTNGYQRRLFVSNAGVPTATAFGRRLALQLAFSTNDATQSPQIVGPIRLYCTLRPLLVDEVTITLQLEDDGKASTAYDKFIALQALQNSQAVTVQDDYWGNTYSARIEDVTANPGFELEDNGGSPDRPKEGHVMIVTVKLIRWNTSGTGIIPS